MVSVDSDRFKILSPTMIYHEYTPFSTLKLSACLILLHHPCYLYVGKSHPERQLPPARAAASTRLSRQHLWQPPGWEHHRSGKSQAPRAAPHRARNFDYDMSDVECAVLVSKKSSWLHEPCAPARNNMTMTITVMPVLFLDWLQWYLNGLICCIELLTGNRMQLIDFFAGLRSLSVPSPGRTGVTAVLKVNWLRNGQRSEWRMRY